MKRKFKGLYVSDEISKKLICIGGMRMVRIVDAIIDYHTYGTKPPEDAPKEVHDIFNEWLTADSKHNNFDWKEDNHEGE